jgi:hypothetical protein
MPVIPANVDKAGKEASAKEWLSIAQGSMKSRNSNAVLISIHGYSSDRGTNLPMDGKCHRWLYSYASPADNRTYDVYVHDGVLENIHERAFDDTGMAGILYKYGDPEIRSWKLDSTEIIGPAIDELKELADRVPSSCAYVLELDYQGRLMWTICFYDETTRVIANIDVYPESGGIGRTWLTPPATD